MKKLFFMSSSEKETRALARAIGMRLKKDACLALIGDFGSGKTTFVKGLVRGLGVKKNNYVCSPSFVILKIYRGRQSVYHFDLYRLNKLEDFFDTGYAEFVQGKGVSVIEWADKMSAVLPREALKIFFKTSGLESRRLNFVSRNAALMKLVAQAIGSMS